MNNKFIAIALVAIIVVASAAGYVIFNGTKSPNTSPTPTPIPTPTPSSTPTTTAIPTTSPTSTSHPTTTPTNSPTTQPTNAPTASPSPSPTPAPVDLRVDIASSLVHVVANMTADFEKANNCHLIINSDSSSALYTQITSGSPVDVFMSADQKWTKQLKGANLLYNNNYVNFTTNSLEVIIAQGNPKGIASMADLANPGVKLVLADPSIPSGSYTNTTCYKIDSTWGKVGNAAYISNGSYVNYSVTVHQNVVSYQLTVEQVVGAVSLNVGTADAGIVFVSDAVWGNMTSAQVQFMPIPASVNTQGTYGIAIIGNTAQSALAQKFMDYWSSTAGQTLLTQFGFNS
jgi:molybdate transport system substrate-binding protein